MSSIKDLIATIDGLKAQLDAFKPYNQTQLRNLRERFRIGFTHHSNAIEGNTMTLTDVKVLLEDGITVGGKSVRELRETLNHGEALDRLYDCFALDSHIPITKELVLSLHATLMQGNLQPNESGTWRTINIHISNSDDQFPSPGKVPQLMEDFFANRVSSLRSLEDIAYLHYEFVKIHPFVDGNGRIARLLMNVALVYLGYFPIIIPMLVRGQYIDSLQGDNFQKRYEFFLWQTKENHKDYVRFLSNE